MFEPSKRRKTMSTVRRQLVFAGLLAFVQLGNCNPVSMTVSKLMESNKSDKFGLAIYFKKLGLDKLCDLPIVDSTDFKTFEDNDSESSCLCTVIYHMNKELEKSNYTNKVDLESVKKKTIKFNDTKVFEMWKQVTKVSPSLKLLMDSIINNITKFNTVCYNKEAITEFCQFLNVEVLLLNNILQNPKESLKKENIINQPVLKEPEIQKSIINDVQKQKEISKNNDEGLVETDIAKELETMSDDDLNQEKQTDAQISSETDSNDYPKEYDGVITDSIAKENVKKMFFGQSNFTNRRYSSTDDSHFLFYFGIMTVISMLFYLALYNKKKIIALIIEGRKGSNHRRRPNTATYSKVETDDVSNVF